MKKFREQSRDRFLQPDELQRFFEALANEPNETARAFFMISLLTGARKSYTLTMMCKDINFVAATWRIEDTKNAEPQTVHCNEISGQPAPQTTSRPVSFGVSLGEIERFLRPPGWYQLISNN